MEYCAYVCFNLGTWLGCIGVIFSNLVKAEGEALFSVEVGAEIFLSLVECGLESLNFLLEVSHLFLLFFEFCSSVVDSESIC